MTAFVILAAGKGTRVGRVGESLHKALLPLDGRAIITHQLERVPADLRVVVVTGYRSEQVREYVRLAHPDLAVTYVHDDEPTGPGGSLLAARDAIGDDGFYVTSCDTLWEQDDSLFNQADRAWIGTAPVPAGTSLERWCLAQVNAYADDLTGVEELYDKPAAEAVETMHSVGRLRAYVGLAWVARYDAATFWKGVTDSVLTAGELQVTGGLDAVRAVHGLDARNVKWTDVGDAVAYRQAVARFSGYDWTKAGEATYILPASGRVVKFNVDPDVIRQRRERGALLRGVPALLDGSESFLAYRYVPGRTVYAELDAYGNQPLDVVKRDAQWLLADLLEWHERTYGPQRGGKLPVPPDANDVVSRAFGFYQRKTYGRVEQLAATRPDLAKQAYDALDHVNFTYLAATVVPALAHGDFNFGNVLYTAPHWKLVADRFTAIDWRGDFAGAQWVDYRYDLGKLLAGCYVQWDAARRGDFRPWVLGPTLAAQVREFVADRLPGQRQVVETIGALSLLNCAPLHAAPLDEVLVARGCAWLAEVTT